MPFLKDEKHGTLLLSLYVLQYLFKMFLIFVPLNGVNQALNDYEMPKLRKGDFQVSQNPS